MLIYHSHTSIVLPIYVKTIVTFHFMYLHIEVKLWQAYLKICR